MTTKITIIDLELNDEVKNIIDGDIAVITQQNRDEIDHAIQHSKMIQDSTEKLLEQKRLKQTEIDFFNTLVDTINTAIIDRGEMHALEIEGMLNKKLTMSQWAVKCRARLKSQGDKYCLVKEDRGKKNIYYKLQVYNA